MARRFVTYNTEDQKAGRVNVDHNGVMMPGGGTGLPSDVGAYKYMATDGDGKWKPVDRLGWKERSPEEIFNQMIEFDSDSGSASLAMSPFGMFVPGEKYDVTIDGVLYDGLVAYDTGYSETGIGAKFIDDGEAPSFTNEMPFVFLTYTTGLEETPIAFHILSILEGAEHTVTIVKTGETTQKISPEYLPEGIGYKEGDKAEITWDGNTDGLEQVENLYKVSNVPLTKSQLNGGKITFKYDGGEDVIPLDVTNVFDDVENGVVSVGNGGIAFLLSVSVDFGPYTAGIYLFSANGSYVSRVEYLTETIHPIPDEYIPRIVITRDYEGNYSCNVPFADMGDMLKRGVPVAYVEYEDDNLFSYETSIFVKHNESSGYARFVIYDVTSSEKKLELKYTADGFEESGGPV